MGYERCHCERLELEQLTSEIIRRKIIGFGERLLSLEKCLWIGIKSG